MPVLARLTLVLLFVASVTASWRERIEAQEDEDDLDGDEDAAGPTGSSAKQGLLRPTRA